MISLGKNSLATVSALVFSALLLPGIAAAEDTSDSIRDAAHETGKANDAVPTGQQGSIFYVFGQSFPLPDLKRERRTNFGPDPRLTPSFGTSASFPARTYEPIPETQSSFGFSLRF